VTRRMTSIGVLPFAAFAAAQADAAVAAPTGAEPGMWTSHLENVLGTSLQVTVRAADQAAAACAEAAALAVFDREAAILSAWQPESEFSRWERTRFEGVPVSTELLATLAAFDAWRDLTDGALDASVEAATQLWKRASAAGRVPTDAEIAQTVEAIAQPHWWLDARHSTATRLSDVPLALATFAKSRIASQAADAALGAGASGVMLNVGGDVVVRGAMTQMVAIADPRRVAENDPALEYVVVSDRAVATSGGYRRGFGDANGIPAYSHLIDPKTARPVGHVLSSTVIARDAETAGALATAFSVLPVEASERLAAQTSGVEYLLVTASGEAVRSAGWARSQGTGGRVQLAGFAKPATPTPGLWNPEFELAIDLTLPRFEEARAHRPYVAVWIEDADHFPVRTLTLWAQNPRWLPELKQWYRDDQMRNLSEGTDISRTISSATRPAGSYTLKWDGKDNQGKPVKAGEYTVVVEAAREHGGYQVGRKSIRFTGKPEQATLAPGQELGTVTLDYRKR
jgi:thiamine biosynthesis lipoprotein